MSSDGHGLRSLSRDVPADLITEKFGGRTERAPMEEGVGAARVSKRRRVPENIAKIKKVGGEREEALL